MTGKDTVLAPLLGLTSGRKRTATFQGTGFESLSGPDTLPPPTQPTGPPAKSEPSSGRVGTEKPLTCSRRGLQKHQLNVISSTGSSSLVLSFVRNPFSFETIPSSLITATRRPQPQKPNRESSATTYSTKFEDVRIPSHQTFQRNLFTTILELTKSVRGRTKLFSRELSFLSN